MTELLKIILVASYWTTTILYFIYFFKTTYFYQLLSKICVFFCLLLHIVYLLYSSVFIFPTQVINVFEILSLLSFILIIVYFIIQQKSRIRTMGIFILPFASILQSISVLSVFMDSNYREFNADIIILISHTLSAIIGYSLLIISSIFGLLYIILYYNLKNTKFNVFFERLPSLEILDNVRQNTTLWGVVLLFFTIILGFFWKMILYNEIFYQDIKIITVFTIFVIYLINYLLGKFTKTNKIFLCFINFFGVMLMLFSLIIANFFFDSFHSFV